MVEKREGGWVGRAIENENDLIALKFCGHFKCVFGFAQRKLLPFLYIKESMLCGASQRDACVFGRDEANQDTGSNRGSWHLAPRRRPPEEFGQVLHLRFPVFLHIPRLGRGHGQRHVAAGVKCDRTSSPPCTVQGEESD